MRNSLTEIANANNAIEAALCRLGSNGRGASSRDALNNLRNLVEHIAVYAVNGEIPQGKCYYKTISQSLDAMRKSNKTRFIYDLHNLLQRSVSHYTLSEDDSERLMLSYYEGMTRLKSYCATELHVNILANLESYPLDTDPGLSEYYRLIANHIQVFGLIPSGRFTNTRYYIHSVKPFFVDSQVYYEYALTDAYSTTSKSDRTIAFSHFRIPDNYAVSLSVQHPSIHVLGTGVAVTIIDDWSTSIWPSELNKLLSILGENLHNKPEIIVKGTLKSYQQLMNYIRDTSLGLNEIALLPQDEFDAIVQLVNISGGNQSIPLLLTGAREHLLSGSPGVNVLTYLLYKPRNKVLDCQICSKPNNLLGNLYLKNHCIPFDKQPFCTSLAGHSPLVKDIFSCINPNKYEDNLLARFVARRSEERGNLYIDEKDAPDFNSIDDLIESYNGTLYEGHTGRWLIHDMKHLFISENETDVTSIIGQLLSMSEGGIEGYTDSCDAWLRRNGTRVDDVRKRDALREVFANSKVGLIFGSAGTGKTTMVNHICSALQGIPKIAIANTNPAVESLRRRIEDQYCECETITKYLNAPRACGLLIVDECSTVSNRDMVQILEKGGFELLLLVGDIRQIKAIRFGNWFALSKAFLPESCIFEFSHPWRSADESLSKVWNLVRNVSPGIDEALVAGGMVGPFDSSLLERDADDEVVLCLNYDGPYGINNINRVLQGVNPNKPFRWRQHTYKVNDPILFNESNRFFPLLYNNLKGRIVGIEQPAKDAISFSVAVDLPINKLTVMPYKDKGLSFSGYSNDQPVVVFSVKKDDDDPDKEMQSSFAIVPFQVSYAISIHKAQGLEFDSVKLVITKDVEKRLSHSIFYTAITRVRKKLRIYWSPETQRYVLDHLEVASHNTDANLLSQRKGLPLHKCSW